MYSHSRTLFLSPPLSCDRICPLFMFFEGALGSWAAGALGTDMNKWTVLHGGVRRAAKHPEQEILHPLSKGLFENGHGCELRRVWSGGYGRAWSEPTCTRRSVRRVHARECTDRYCRLHTQTHTHVPLCLRSNRSLFWQQTKWTVPKTMEILSYWKGVFQNRKLIFDSNAFRKCCLVRLEMNISLDPSAHFELNA